MVVPYRSRRLNCFGKAGLEPKKSREKKLSNTEVRAKSAITSVK